MQRRSRSEAHSRASGGFICPKEIYTKTSAIWNTVRNEEKDKNKQKPGWGGKEKKNQPQTPKPNEHTTALKENQNTERLFTANTNAPEPTP